MMPSPITWFTVPSYSWTASIITSSTGSRIFRASSGSRCAMSSIDPLRSAKSTVTCLRSPSAAAGGDATRRSSATSSRVGRPQPGQNFADGGSGRWQLAHVAPMAAPQWPQYLASGSTSCAQLGHFIGGARRLEPRLVDGQPERVSTDELVVREPGLQMLRDHVDVLEVPLDRMTLVRRGGAGRIVHGVD